MTVKLKNKNLVYKLYKLRVPTQIRVVLKVPILMKILDVTVAILLFRKNMPKYKK